MVERDIKLDFQRRVRLGLDEAIFCDHKTLAQLTAILEQARERETTQLLTRLDELQFAALSESHRAHMDYELVSRTAYYGILFFCYLPLHCLDFIILTSWILLFSLAVLLFDYLLRHRRAFCIL